jgi:hypothetical protein
MFTSSILKGAVRMSELVDERVRVEITENDGVFPSVIRGAFDYGWLDLNAHGRNFPKRNASIDVFKVATEKAIKIEYGVDVRVDVFYTGNEHLSLDWFAWTVAVLPPSRKRRFPFFWRT